MRIYRAINKALAGLLMISIIGVGAFAVSLTHIHAEFTLTFGDQKPQQVAMADVVPTSWLEPLPTPLTHKRK